MMVFAFAFLILESSVKIRMLLNSFLMNICKYKINSWKNKRRCLAALNKSHKIQRNERVRGIVLNRVISILTPLYFNHNYNHGDNSFFKNFVDLLSEQHFYFCLHAVLTFATENSVQPF